MQLNWHKLPYYLFLGGESEFEVEFRLPPYQVSPNRDRNSQIMAKNPLSDFMTENIFWIWSFYWQKWSVYPYSSILNPNFKSISAYECTYCLTICLKVMRIYEHKINVTHLKNCDRDFGTCLKFDFKFGLAVLETRYANYGQFRFINFLKQL